MTQQEYQQEIDFIFNRFPSYQKVGKVAYKPGIETMLALDGLLGFPHRSYRTIHVAGTNGKGSTSHFLAAALQKNYKVGLYTSPHLVDFRERVKVNGEMVSREFVYSFLKEYKDKFVEMGASFFEITTALAFAYFAQQKVDIAVIECGLGGRLDSTNIISPVLSVITNIGLDHCEHLGFSLPEVAAEKAGIIKPGVPVVIGEKGCAEVENVFREKAAQVGAPIFFAQDEVLRHGLDNGPERLQVNEPDNLQENAQEKEQEKGNLWGRMYGELLGMELDLKGACQEKNLKGVSVALELLGENFKVDGCVENICRAAKITGLRGRWETLCEAPLVICDTGHNSHGFKVLGKQIASTAAVQQEKFPGSRFHMVFGVVADKDLDSIVGYLPRNAYYHYVNARGTRALPAQDLEARMKGFGFEGEVSAGSIGECLAGLVPVNDVAGASGAASKEDFIFVGGSTFVVAEALEYFG